MSRWRPGPARLAKLVAGLWLFGTGEALVVNARFGNSPWSVLAQGVARHTPLSIGTATIVISALVLLAWIPLRQAPGLGTILNAILVGVAIDVTLGFLAADPGGGVRVVELAGGILCVAAGSGLYLTCALAPGPRDGLMTGLHRRFGFRVGSARTGVELSALVAGALLGGRFGVGTLLFAVSIGPLVALALRAQGAEVARL